MEDNKDNKGVSTSVKPTKFTMYWGKILPSMKDGTNLIKLLNSEIQIILYAYYSYQKSTVKYQGQLIITVIQQAAGIMPQVISLQSYEDMTYA